MTGGPKAGKAKDTARTAPPDGEPRQPSRDRDGTAKSKMSDVQDPLIAGDASKANGRAEANEANVDEAGQLRRRKGEVDLLH